jgi:P-type conjugative transfer protein TrbL
MANDIAVIDRFLDIFSRYIDSGFGLISGDVGFLVKILIGIDVVLAALAWAAGEDEVIQAFAKKVLYVGFFAFILNNWNSLAQAIFKSFAALGLKATGSSLSYANFLRPGKLAQAGVQGADVLLAQIQRLSGFPEVFWNLSEIMLMALSWVVTLIAFFVLAIMLFLAVIEFKLTTLKGFILVPFALWRRTSFIAEPVLGQVITSGVRILVFAVVTGIGTQIFSQILPSNPTAELSLQDALTVLLASMTVGGLASMHPKSPRASCPARRSSGSVLPWRRPRLLAARSCWAGLDWQERLEPVPARSPRRQRLAVLHALLTRWGAPPRATKLWLALAEASSALLAQVSRQPWVGCARPATGLPTAWLNAFERVSARVGLRLEDQQSARLPKALVCLILRGHRAGPGNFAGSR